MDILVLHFAFSGISHISKMLLFKFIRDAVADKKNAVFHYFCAYLHSV